MSNELGIASIRTSLSVATEYLNDLLPNVSSRRNISRILGRSIEYAHRQASACWELTGRDGFIRLNVGQIAVMEVNSDDLYLYATKGRRLSAPGLEYLDHEYSAVSERTERCLIPLDAVEQLPEDLLERHRELIAAAAAAKRKSPFARYHSPAIVEAIARAAGTSLPKPAYAAPNIDDDSSDDDQERPRPTNEDEETSDVRRLFGDPIQNAEVERAAVTLVTKTLQAEGWTVRSVESQGCGYDLLCSRSGEILHAEVKGKFGAADQFVVTAGEVRQASNDPHFALFAVAHALTDSPSVEQWSGAEFGKLFELRTLQYAAKRKAPSKG